MNKFKLLTFQNLGALLLIIFGIGAQNVQAQVLANDSAIIGAGYTDQVFYSFQNGTVKTESNTNWDLAFQISGFQAAIYVNSKNNVKLYKSMKDTTSWSTITTADTAGLMVASNQLLNSDTSWSRGAFNQTMNVSNQFDLGWGVYDFGTHFVIGDSIYFLQLSNGTVKKLWIRDLANGVYHFSYANLDGTSLIDGQLDKTLFPNRIFGYYSLTTNATLDREPNKTDWDLSFAQYMAVTPITYKVTGVLQNTGVLAEHQTPVDTALASYNAANLNPLINNIAYNWKSFDFATNAWNIADSTVYFVQDKAGSIWKLIFTGFGGGATGKFLFNKELVIIPNAINNPSLGASVALFPNPTTNQLNVIHGSNCKNIQLINLLGTTLLSVDVKGGIQTKLDVSNLNAGTYFIRAEQGKVVSFIKQ
jgi:Secretion system C-terminal sorting domain